MTFQPTHRVDYLEEKSIADTSFSGNQPDDYIVHRLVSELKYPEYGFPRKVRGWRVVEIATGRVLGEENF